jgi:predicted Rossmann-fold nucleotide-binding protein
MSPSTSSSGGADAISIDLSVAKSAFCSQPAERSLRITCYGSSSAKTPEPYLKEARALGYILAKRGHVCVNGAGSFGCMAAMNDGAVAGDGHIVGVIHEMFMVDNGYGGKRVDRDGGAHRAFQSLQSSQIPFDERTGPIREILVAGGNDLQQRKKFLVDKTEGLVVLPGGPGTWDELWEMACARHLGLTDLPIVCINVNDYYAPFEEMLHRAYDDDLIKLRPHEIVHFASSAEEAVQWIEGEKAGHNENAKKSILRKASVLKRSSFMSPEPGVFRRSASIVVEKYSRFTGLDELSLWSKLGMTFVAGALCGFAAASLDKRK